MPFKTFHSWLFDGSRNSPIPKATEKIDILKYNSPITHTYVLSMFPKNGPLNHYLNTYLNNINLRYLEKEDLFKFIKKCVLDFRLKKRDVTYFPYKRQTKLFQALREKIPEFKNNEINILCKMVDKSKDKNSIYEALSIEKLKKKKLGKKQKQKGKISLKMFLDRNFSILNVE
jgi:hypothetical protein